MEEEGANTALHSRCLNMMETAEGRIIVCELNIHSHHVRILRALGDHSFVLVAPPVERKQVPVQKISGDFREVFLNNCRLDTYRSFVNSWLEKICSMLSFCPS